jgi:hypothetical protein
MLYWLEKKQDWKNITIIGHLVQEKNYTNIITNVFESLCRMRKLSKAGLLAWIVRQKVPQNSFYLSLIQYCLENKKYCPLNKVIPNVDDDAIFREDKKIIKKIHELICHSARKLKKEKKKGDYQELKKIELKTKKLLLLFELYII